MFSESDLIIIVLTFLLSFISERVGSQEYHYENKIVIVYDKYQCPVYCGVNHNHYVYYNKEITGDYRMYINQTDLGKKIKKNNKK